MIKFYFGTIKKENDLSPSLGNDHIKNHNLHDKRVVFCEDGEGFIMTRKLVLSKTFIDPFSIESLNSDQNRMMRIICTDTLMMYESGKVMDDNRIIPFETASQKLFSTLIPATLNYKSRNYRCMNDCNDCPLSILNRCNSFEIKSLLQLYEALDNEIHYDIEKELQ